MNDISTDGWIGDAWNELEAEVLGKDWPPEMIAVVRIAFYSGAGWILTVLEEEGTSPETMKRLHEEYDLHRERAEAAATTAEKEANEKPETD